MLMLRGKPYDTEFYRDIQAEFNEPDANGKFTLLSIDNLQRYLRVCASFKRTPTTLLDAGCRDGAILIAAREVVPNLVGYGVDIVPAHIKETVAKGFDAVEADIHALPFKAATFDSTYCSQTLEHCYNPSLALSELFRVTRNTLFVGVPLEEEGDFEENPSHYARSLDPFDWFDLVRPHTDRWLLIESYMNTVTPYLNMIFVRHEHL